MNNRIPAPQGGAPCVVLALALAGSLSFARAELAEEMPEVELAPVTVSALGGLAVPYDQTGVSVSVLDIPELKREGIDALNEALLTVPGVMAQPDGQDQRGNVSNIAIRGMHKAAYTLPMMDGMRLYSVGGANITPNVLGRTGLFSLGRVELLRGSQGAVYGAGAMGGVIYMETPEGEGNASLTLFNEVGSFDSYTGSAVAQGRVNKLAYFISSTYEHTNNDIEFADGRPVNVKHAGRYAAWNEALRLDYDLNPENKLTLTYRREDADYKAVSQWGAEDYAFRTNLLTAKWQSKLSRKLGASLMAGYYGQDNRFSEDFSTNLRNVQLEGRALYRWNERHSSTAGISWNRSDYRSISSTPGMDDTLDNTYGLFVEHTYRPAANWDNSLALRWDQSSVWDGLVSFRAASNYRFNQERTRIFGSVGSGYAAPSALQRGGVYESLWGRYRGNPALDCEQNVTVDGGVEQQIAREHYVSATLFWTRMTNGIDLVPTDDPAWQTYANSNSHWTSQGIELAAQGTWEKHWNTGYRMAFTYTQPKDGQDKQLKQTSRQMWSADIHTSPLEGLTTGIGLTASSGRCDYAGIRLDHYCVLRWYARYLVNEQLSLHLRVENLTGDRFISSSTGEENQAGALLSAGAALYGGCTLTF